MFCTKYEEINGKEACTPNMHLHLHLIDCLKDYGHLYAFWCFAFERYNGMLGSFPTNQKNIEPQLMRKCLLMQELYSQSFSSDADVFKITLAKHLPVISGGLLSASTGDEMQQFIPLSAATLSEALDFKCSGNETLLPPVKHVVLDGNVANNLKCSYELLYPGTVFSSFHQFARKSSRASFANEVYGSQMTSRENNIVVMAYWPSCSDMLPTEGRNLPKAAGEIQFFLKHNSGVKGEHVFAFVCWYKRHIHFDWFGSSAIVYCNEYESDNSYSFIPIQRLLSLCVYGNIQLSFDNQQTFENVVVVSPIHFVY